MQRVHVTDHARFNVAGEEAFSGLPVVERDTHLVVARQQRADVDFPTQWDLGARADAGVALGDALTTLIDDMHGEGKTGEELLVQHYGNRYRGAAGRPRLSLLARSI